MQDVYTLQVSEVLRHHFELHQRHVNSSANLAILYFNGVTGLSKQGSFDDIGTLLVSLDHPCVLVELVVNVTERIEEVLDELGCSE